MTAVPDRAKKPTDHLEAVKSEATGEPLEPLAVEFNSDTYHVDADALNDIELLDLIADIIEDNKVYLMPRAVRRLVRADEWDRFIEANRDGRGKVRAEVLAALFQALNEGLAAGN